MIKKISQTTPVSANIVDNYSTSTTDGYSCNYVNGKTGVVLYNNSTGTTGDLTFDGNYTNYDYIMISNDIGTGLLCTIKNELDIINVNYSDTLYQQYDYIKLTYNSSTQKTTIHHEHQGNYYNNSNHNANYKIYKVYGIKM